MLPIRFVELMWMCSIWSSGLQLTCQFIYMVLPPSMFIRATSTMGITWVPRKSTSQCARRTHITSTCLSNHHYMGTKKKEKMTCGSIKKEKGIRKEKNILKREEKKISIDHHWRCPRPHLAISSTKTNSMRFKEVRDFRFGLGPKRLVINANF
ncbi:hypothetical protein BRADI_5g07715v3 [Brachypodium distachyon]|uniref:Uncharacterized protein n=1 Tax=Brachypodium distachyon TaxID=15368 RepID=A0A0Q3E3L6_BRADI|nr:hypothetical protein BRADI_5g07715v3 [Brachypodium distachyon]